jgi:hypothetical protein
MDLGATDVKCRVFCHFGCSTFKHNYPILRKRKGWKRTPDDRFAYWTTASALESTPYWLHYLFVYPKENAFQSWYPSLQWAVQKTNVKLRNLRHTYRLI